MNYEITDQPDLLKLNSGFIRLIIVDNDVFETEEIFSYSCRITRQAAYKQAYRYFDYYKDLPLPTLNFG